MLSPLLLELLRDWYRIARPTLSWLFPGRDPLLPLTTRQFNLRRSCRSRSGGDESEVSSLARCDAALPPACSKKTDVRLIQVSSCQSGHATALRTGGHQR